MLGIRPEDVTIGDEGMGGEVYIIEPLGRETLVDVHIGDASVLALVDAGLGLKIGQNVSISCNADKVQLFDPETERSLLWE